MCYYSGKGKVLSCELQSGAVYKHGRPGWKDLAKVTAESMALHVGMVIAEFEKRPKSLRPPGPGLWVCNSLPVVVDRSVCVLV